jgi:hypothetical protein
VTPLDKSLKRSISIKGDDYVITLAPEGLKISRKGHRLGIELKWTDLVSGESALAVALNASIGRFEAKEVRRPRKSPVARAKGRARAGRTRAPKPR